MALDSLGVGESLVSKRTLGNSIMDGNKSLFRDASFSHMNIFNLIQSGLVSKYHMTKKMQLVTIAMCILLSLICYFCDKRALVISLSGAH